MIVYPHAKINLGLHVLEKRSDGYHQIESLLYPVFSLCDILEIKRAAFPELFLYGIPVEGKIEENLCMKAYRMLAADFDFAPMQLHLYKQIPSGAGLGGGSSDGAFTLQLLNSYCQLGLSSQQLEEYAARLGSDCPSFLYKRPSLAMGRGDILEDYALDLSPYHILIKKPPIAISTAKAYAGIQPKQPLQALKEVLQQPVHSWKDTLVNDFEASLFPEYPILQEYKQKFYASGALYASLSGSGSALYGIYDSWDKFQAARLAL